MTFVPDLLFYIEAQLGYKFGTEMFRGPRAVMPNGDGPFTSIIENQGFAPEGTHNAAGAAYLNPSAQLLTRAAKYSVARTRAQQLWDLLQPVQNQFIDGTWWRELHMQGEVFDLTPDEQGRVRVAFNIDAVKRSSPATS